MIGHRPGSLHHRPAALRRGTLAALLLAGVCSVQAQGVRIPGGMPLPGDVPLPVTPGTDPAQLPGIAPVPTIGPLVGPGGAAPVVPGAAVAPPPVARTLYLEGDITARLTATDRGRLDAPSGKDLILGVSPRLYARSRGAQLNVNAMVGLDSIKYFEHTNDDYTQPVAAIDAQAILVDNLLFLDGGLSVDRRASSPYSTQTADVSTDEQVDTRIARLSPRLERRLPSGWNTLLRSDNIWTHRSGDSVGGLTGAPAREYSQDTQFRVDRTPEPFGLGLEGSHELLQYDSRTVMQIDGVRATAGYAYSPQLTVWGIGGVERSDFQNRTENDSDYGFRVRWAPLERSVLTAEVRRRFFGTGFNAQWDHTHRNFGFTLAGAREPYTSPEAVQLGGNIGQQFNDLFRQRGYDQAQREALVRAALIAYGLPATLADPVSFHVSRPQLNTSGSAMFTALGRRSVFIASVYYRKLTDLHRSDDPVLATLPGNTRQAGGQVSANFRLTPLSALDASYRIDDTQGLGADASRSSRDQIYSIGTTHSLSPHTRVDLSLQHHKLETVDVLRPSSASSNSAGIGINYRF